MVTVDCEAWVISFARTLLLLEVVDMVIGPRVLSEDRETGLHVTQHCEESYEWAS